MEKKKYDIFISYRRVGGKDYARTLKPELEKRGFHVFLDFAELKDGVFDKRIMAAIEEAPIFLLILSKGALDRCVNEDDWVREEILYADKVRRHIVPVEVDKTFRAVPENVPQDVKSVLGLHQFSQIDTETLMQESIDKMVRERINPYVIKDSAKTSPDVVVKGSAEIHIEVDADCSLFRFKELVTSLSAIDDNVVYLHPGKHKLEFVSQEYSDIKESVLLDVPYENYSDVLTVSLLARIKERRAEEEAKRKAEEKARMLEEAKRREEEAKRRSEEVYQKGKELYDKKDYSQAYPLILKAAELNHPEAQYDLGCMCYEGRGVSQDYSETLRWFRKSAEQGFADAQFCLGLMYDNGEGVPQDYFEAVKWYREAAWNNHIDAQCKLGWMYDNGRGVSRDYSEALKWFRKSAEHGNAEAKYTLGLMYYEGKGVSWDYSEAAKWYYKAAWKGHPEAQYRLGRMYQYGEGVSRNYSEAVEYFNKAANYGHADAQVSLGVMYEKGEGVSRDYSEAAKWYREAADQGHTLAKYRLEECLKKQNPIKSWFNRLKS